MKAYDTAPLRCLRDSGTGYKYPDLLTKLKSNDSVRYRNKLEVVVVAIALDDM